LSDKVNAFTRIRGYFERLPEEDVHEVHEVSDLRRTMEIYHALIGAGLIDDAFALLDSRLREPLLEALGANSTMIELLTPLFKSGISSPPALTKSEYQASALLSMGMAYWDLGDLARADALLSLSIGFAIEKGDTFDLFIYIMLAALCWQDRG